MAMPPVKSVNVSYGTSIKLASLTINTATVFLLRGPAYGGYNGWWTYVDETGALFARGFNKGRETRAQFLVEGVF